ncbi:MAG: hypothetical protein JST62_04875 [Bacteroidetes bacterium]|jgi:hypothetical protein|nr:hypothetical protein [Bacteroidota bacterium]
MKKLLIFGAFSLSSLIFAKDKMQSEKNHNVTLEQKSVTIEKNDKLMAILLQMWSVSFTSSCGGNVTAVFESNAPNGSAEFINDLAYAVNYSELNHCYVDGADSFMLLK